MPRNSCLAVIQKNVDESFSISRHKRENKGPSSSHRRGKEKRAKLCNITGVPNACSSHEFSLKSQESVKLNAEKLHV